MSGWLLAFDTSTEQMAVAVYGPRGERVANEPGGARASARLLPCIHELLADAGLALAGVDAVAFGRGPGAFTGLRTSCAVAQGLGFGLQRRLLPVDSLLVVAEDARAQLGAGDGFDVGVVMDARIDEVYAGRWRWQQGRWHEVSPPALLAPAALAAWWPHPPGWLAGSAIAAFGSRLGLPAGLPRVDTERDRGAALLRLARLAHASGAGVDAADALPLYLRDKVALTTQERDAVRGGGR